MDQARRNMVGVNLSGDTLQYPLVGNHGAAKVFMKPASEGTGIIAGGGVQISSASDLDVTGVGCNLADL